MSSNFFDVSYHSANFITSIFDHSLAGRMSRILFKSRRYPTSSLSSIPFETTF